MFGGHVEQGESYSETLVRELQEELGITSTQWTYLETITVSTFEGQDEPPYQLAVHLYHVTA